jgi:hypothetical protein
VRPTLLYITFGDLAATLRGGWRTRVGPCGELGIAGEFKNTDYGMQLNLFPVARACDKLKEGEEFKGKS